MKIVLINNIFPPGFIGGYELGALEVARGLKALGHQVFVLTSDYYQDDAGELPDLNVERNLECCFISHYPESENAVRHKGVYVSYGNIRKLGSAIRRYTPDVVLLFNLMGLGPLGMMRFLQASGVPAVLYLMDNVFALLDRKSEIHSKYISIFGEICFSTGVKTIAMSRNVMREVVASLGMPLADVSYVPGWIHVPASAKDLAVVSQPCDVRFVVCARVAPHKGTDIIVDAAEELVRRGVTGFSIDVYGAGQVSPFMQRVQSKKLGSYVRYMGCRPKEEMLNLFGQYEALLFPTWEREPFGFTVGEAAAAGCFPIMTSGIGASEWFVADVDCMKIARTTESLVSAMLRTIYMGPEERLELRRSAMRSARRNLSFDRWIKLIEGTCREAAANSTGQTIERSHGVQAAFLFLTHMWQTSL